MKEGQVGDGKERREEEGRDTSRGHDVALCEDPELIG
jgi:hypothetical protein